MSDPINSGTCASLQALRKLALHVAMPTGENELTAEVGASQLQIDEFKPNVTPEEKNNIIRSLRKEGHRVATSGTSLVSRAMQRAQIAKIPWKCGAST